MVEQQVVVDGAEIHVEVVGDGPPVVLIHGLGLSGELWNRVAAALGPGYGSSSSTSAAPAGRASSSRESSRSQRWADDLGAVLDNLGLERPVAGRATRSGRRSRSSSRSSGPTTCDALVLIGAEADLSNLAPRMLASAERIESVGLETWVEDFWSKNPPFAEPSLERDRRDPRRVPEPPAGERSRSTTSASAGRSQRRSVLPGVSARSGSRRWWSSAAATTAPCPSTAASSPRAPATHASSSCPEVGHTIPLEAPEATRAASRLPRGGRSGRPTGAPACSAPTRRRATRREGPFGHLDVRWVVGPQPVRR